MVKEFLEKIKGRLLHEAEVWKWLIEQPIEKQVEILKSVWGVYTPSQKIELVTGLSLLPVAPPVGQTLLTLFLAEGGASYLIKKKFGEFKRAEEEILQKAINKIKEVI